MFLRLLVILLLNGLFALTAFAQIEVPVDSTRKMVSIDLDAGLHEPIYDLSQRFGNSAYIGGTVRYHLANKWDFGLSGGFIFGRTVKDPIATGIQTADGFIIDAEGAYSEILLQQRAMRVEFTLGRLFPIIGPTQNSGLVLRVGGGFFQHKVRLEARRNDVPQIEEEYAQLYDRLTNGPAISQFIGYQNVSKSKKINFTIGLEMMQAFTQNRRDYNVDLGGPDDRMRLDGLYGLRVSWSFLIDRGSADDFYY